MWPQALQEWEHRLDTFIRADFVMLGCGARACDAPILGRMPQPVLALTSSAGMISSGACAAGRDTRSVSVIFVDGLGEKDHAYPPCRTVRGCSDALAIAVGLLAGGDSP
jgi:hypothetical protein